MYQVCYSDVFQCLRYLKLFAFQHLIHYISTDFSLIFEGVSENLEKGKEIWGFKRLSHTANNGGKFLGLLYITP